MTDPGMATSVLVSVAALAYVALTWLIEKPKYPLERDRDNRKEEPEVSTNKRFLAMMNRLPIQGQRLAWIDFAYGGYEEQEDGAVVMDAPIEEANAITSLMDIPAAGAAITLHKPILDIDHRVIAIESSTPGHSHLYVDLPMPWEDLVKLLDVMVEIGLVEPGYAEACKDDGYTTLRLPWVPKSELADR